MMIVKMIMINLFIIDLFEEDIDDNTDRNCFEFIVFDDDDDDDDFLVIIISYHLKNFNFKKKCFPYVNTI